MNFWQPSGGKTFRALAHSELFPFKFHSRNDYIASGGVFSHTPNVPLSIAWDAFGAKNGVVSLADMRRRIANYRREILPDRHWGWERAIGLNYNPILKARLSQRETESRKIRR